MVERVHPGLRSRGGCVESRKLSSQYEAHFWPPAYQNPELSGGARRANPRLRVGRPAGDFPGNLALGVCLLMGAGAWRELTTACRTPDQTVTWQTSSGKFPAHTRLISGGPGTEEATGV